MKTRVVCLAPGHISPGMVLASSITGQDGHTLLSRGTILDSEILDRLIRRGIETALVSVLDNRDDETIAMELRAAELRIGHIFRGKSNAAREALRGAILDFRLESAQ